MKITTKAFDHEIQCPTCDFNYTHIKRADIQDGHDNSWHGIGGYRGDVAVIKMYCENGHLFNINIGEHKGNCFISLEPKGDISDL
jgi:hypothetical protein